MIIFRTTVWTDSDRWRVKNLIFNFGRTPPFTILDGTTSVGNSFMFERENAFATNYARTAYYMALGLSLFIWVVPTVIVTVPSFRRWNTFSRIGTFELCWRTVYWNGGERLHALNSNDFISLTKSQKCKNLTFKVNFLQGVHWNIFELTSLSSQLKVL